MPPVIHVDTDATLYSDVDALKVITDRIWGIYYKPDFNFGGVQGGAMPFKVKADPAQVKIDPYGPASLDFVVGRTYADVVLGAPLFCQKRFEGQAAAIQEGTLRGIGSFTADNFPVFGPLLRKRLCDCRFEPRLQE